MVSSGVDLIYSWLKFLPSSTKENVSNEQGPWTCLIVSGQRCVRTPSQCTTCRTPDEIPAQCTWSPPVGYIVWVIHQGAREGQWSEVCLYPNPLTKPTGTISAPSVYLISDRLN